MKAEWNGVVIAESDDIVEVEGNPYFPLSSVNKDYLVTSDTNTVCHWKGNAACKNRLMLSTVTSLYYQVLPLTTLSMSTVR